MYTYKLYCENITASRKNTYNNPQNNWAKRENITHESRTLVPAAAMIQILLCEGYK